MLPTPGEGNSMVDPSPTWKTEEPDRTITSHRFEVMTQTISECIYRKLIRDGHEYDEAMELFIDKINEWLSRCSSDYILYCFETMGGNINDISLWPGSEVSRVN